MEFLRRKMQYKLPDGNLIGLKGQEFECAEILFSARSNSANSSMQDILTQCICKCDIDIRRDMLKNVVTAGRGSLFDNFAERLKWEMRDKVEQIHPDGKLKLIVPPERAYSGWIGGSILASLSTFEEMWITAADYAES